jgi:hypothetical protein
MNGGDRFPLNNDRRARRVVHPTASSCGSSVLIPGKPAEGLRGAPNAKNRTQSKFCSEIWEQLF